MRINAVEISWFRGAADPVAITPECKSMVVYGENGSGKSSFVDSVEYSICNGRITHLAHEYSGKRLEKAILNTHKPPEQKAMLRILFKDNSQFVTEIAHDGTQTCSGSTTAGLDDWDYKQIVLRQHEVSDFVNGTKRTKYSVLLPLLGLTQMEAAAENVRQLAKKVDQQAKTGELRGSIKVLRLTREKQFGRKDDVELCHILDDLWTVYCPDLPAVDDVAAKICRIEETLVSHLSKLSVDSARYNTLKKIADIGLKNDIATTRSAAQSLANFTEPLISEKLHILEAAADFASTLLTDGEIKCPACGREIQIAAFKDHIRTEREHLQDVMSIFSRRKIAISELCDHLNTIKNHLATQELLAWRTEISRDGDTARFLTFVDGLDTNAIRSSCSEDTLLSIEENLFPILALAVSFSGEAPPEVTKLNEHRETVKVIRDSFACKNTEAELARAEALITFLQRLERAIRDDIKARAQTIVRDISEDIQAMWEILHPNEPIDLVRLYIPEESDKAIDIGLRFHQVDQDSPRLTLSEGHRNSLGLCIFLAMALRGADKDRPLFLDDVVISLDRNHRGMIAEILRQRFAKRQVIILTHDREWYSELRHQLDLNEWQFRALLPYDNPRVGIRWSNKTTTFDDARAQLKDRPDSAGNDARKIMDVELALLAERLQIKLPFLRGEKNDHRTAHDFLERMMSVGRKAFQRRAGDNYLPFTEAIDALENADRLLVSWGNRASHTFDVTNAEASLLIDTCEKAISYFTCASCGRLVSFADSNTREWLQCQCGDIRWRYGIRQAERQPV